MKAPADERDAKALAQQLAEKSASALVEQTDATPGEKRRRVKKLIEEPAFAARARQKNPGA